MRKLFMLLLMSMLGGTFATVEQFNELQERVEYLESQLVEAQTWSETLYLESDHFTIEYVIEDGWVSEVVLCEVTDGECETYYPKDEQYQQLGIDDRDAVISDIESYLALLESLREALSGGA